MSTTTTEMPCIDCDEPLNFSKLLLYVVATMCITTCTLNCLKTCWDLTKRRQQITASTNLIQQNQIRQLETELPTINYNSIEYPINDSCAICIEDFNNDDIVRKFGCSHIYHSECVDTWVIENNTCPICKITVITNPNPGEEALNAFVNFTNRHQNFGHSFS